MVSLIKYFHMELAPTAVLHLLTRSRLCNMLTLTEYLDYTYEFLFNGTPLPPCLNIFSFLDSVHFLKKLTEKTNKMNTEKYAS